MDPTLAVTVVIALGFAWTNGFHDAANSVGTSLATGALTPRVALGLAALLDVVGGLFGVSIAETLRRGILTVPVASPGVGLVAAALLAALGWNLLTWWWGLPSSSSHALFGGLAGAGLAAGAAVDGGLLRDDVVLPLLLSPVLGFAAAWALTAVLLRVSADAGRAPALRRFRLAQSLAAAATAVGHGLQDAQKTAAVIVLALVAGGAVRPGDGVPFWVRGGVALALGAGTATGGWRLIRTVGRRIAPVDPLTGFAAQLVTAGSLYTAAGLLAVPVSSTHVVVASIIGGGATDGPAAIRWRQVRRIAVAFVLTPLATAALAAALYQLWR